MIRVLRQVVGGALGVAGVALPGWAMFHLIRQGSCGDVGQAACPDEVAVWILSLVGAVTLLCPAAIFIAGRDRATGRILLLGPIMVLTTLSFVAGIVVSLVGASADPGTQWIGYVLGAIAVLIFVRVAIWLVRSVRSAMPHLTAHPTSAAEMQQLATALSQVQATRAPKVAKPAKAPKPDPDLAARLRKLDELHGAGVIDDAEHRRRRDEILAEI
jgi:hypothetical protein